VEDIRSMCDLVELVSTYVTLKRSGRHLKGLCPFHNEKTPSFTVNSDTQRYRCFGCGENGDVFSFLMRMENLTFQEAVEQLARKAGIQLERSPEQAKQFSERELIFRANALALTYFRTMLNRNAHAVEYLERRGFTKEMIERYHIGYAPDQWRGLSDFLVSHKIRLPDAVKAGLIIRKDNSNTCYDRFRDRVIFPILDVQERVLGFGGRVMGDGQPKYLNSPETPVFYKNRTLYGLNIARRTINSAGYVIVVEGYMDALTVQSAGFENAVATMGTALTQEHISILSRYTQNAVLAFDSDSAGMSAALRSAPMFEEAGFNVRVIDMPSGHDPDSFLKRGDAGAFRALIENALPIVDFRIKKIKDSVDLHSSEGRLMALKRILPVLAEVRDTVDRERLISELAPLHPNFSTGTGLAEDHLRREADRLAAKVHSPRQPVEETVGKTAKIDIPSPAGLSSLQKAEMALLGKIICNSPDAQQALESLAPDGYFSEDARTLAAAVHTQYAALGTLELSQLNTELEGTSASEVLNEILVRGDSLEYSSESIEQLVKVITNYKKKEKLKKFRLLADRVRNGQINDQEVAEYMSLQRELKGSSPS
jgi:DNA primase